MCARYPELIKEAQINSLAIYDATNPVVKTVVAIREVVMEILCEYLEKTKFLLLKDIPIFNNKIKKKIDKRIKYDTLSVDSYFRGEFYGKKLFDITKDLFISIRLNWKPIEGSVLYIPTEVRYYYGEV